MSDLCRFFPLSTTIIDTKKTRLMFHRFRNPLLAHLRAFAGTIPAHHFQLLTQIAVRVTLTNSFLTHDLTHQMTHVFGSSDSHEMSAPRGVCEKSRFAISVHFLPVFLTAIKLCQMSARILTQTNDTACSLSYSLTFKTVIL